MLTSIYLPGAYFLSNKGVQSAGVSLMEDRSVKRNCPEVGLGSPVALVKDLHPLSYFTTCTRERSNSLPSTLFGLEDKYILSFREVVTKIDVLTSIYLPGAYFLSNKGVQSAGVSLMDDRSVKRNCPEVGLGSPVALVKDLHPLSYFTTCTRERSNSLPSTLFGLEDKYILSFREVVPKIDVLTSIYLPGAYFLSNKGVQSAGVSLMEDRSVKRNCPEVGLGSPVALVKDLHPLSYFTTCTRERSNSLPSSVWRTSIYCPSGKSSPRSMCSPPFICPEHIF